MARPGRKPKEETAANDVVETNQATAARRGRKPARQRSNGRQTAEQEESISGYFRRLLKENPKLLKQRGNEELLERWFTDHPGQKEDRERLRQILSNVKSVMRRKSKRRGRPRKEQAAEVVPGTLASAPFGSEPLVALEVQIDECLMLGRNLDREGLANVIDLLRQARNKVVRKLGQ